ncbi:MAG: radical SAM protein [Myxococcales bacterium]|nr:radical SAM protein [Myxococcales bacterium]
MSAARVLVVHPPASIARDFIDYPYFSELGAVQVAAVLGAIEEVALVDAFALPEADLRWRADGRADLGAPADAVLAAVDRHLEAGPLDFVVVALTPFHRPPSRDDNLAATLAGLRARLPGALLLLADCYQSGQHYVEASGPALLAAYPEIDAWVRYEGEVALPALLAAWREGGARPEGVIDGAPPPDLDALPLPAWDRVDLEATFAFHARVIAGLGRGAWAFPIDGRTLPMVTSRGCPFRCLHCSSNPGRAPGAPKTQRRLSAARMGEAMARLRELGAARIAVLDELINVNEAHFDAFLAHAAALDLRFEIPNGMRADYLEPRHLEVMRGRITTLSVSAESGSQRVVTEVVGKRLDLRAIVAAAEAAHAAGVPLMIHYMIGLPGESAAEVNQTLAFALDLWDRFGAFPAVQFATPLPGTALADASDRRHLPLAGDWGPHFQGAPTPGVAQIPPAELERFMATFRQRLEASQGPKKLVMNVTYVCNNHCTFCAVGTRTQLAGHPTRQREHLLEYRRQGVTMVDFDGGEPTLNPELIPLIRYARALGYNRINVTTNGRLCFYEDYAGKLVRSGLTTLLFSVHGADARTHAQQVGVAEAYEQTIGGIKNCVRLAPAGVELGMNVTLTKGNADQQDALAELAWELGLRWLNIQFLTPFGRATRMIAPDTAAAAAGTRALLERWRDRMKIQVINLPYCFLPGFEEHLQGDLAKLERHMVFVNNETVNLAGYLAERRTRRPVCEGCPHACFCGGFYELDQVPEPPWLIAPEDLVRPISDPRRHESVPAGFRERVGERVRDES